MNGDRHLLFICVVFLRVGTYSGKFPQLPAMPTNASKQSTDYPEPAAFRLTIVCATAWDMMLNAAH
jgi:hypothetical protein